MKLRVTNKLGKSSVSGGESALRIIIAGGGWVESKADRGFRLLATPSVEINEETVINLADEGFLEPAEDITARDVDWIKNAAAAALAKMPDNSAFILLACPFGESPRLRYISNMKRESGYGALKQFIEHIEADPSGWMRHA